MDNQRVTTTGTSDGKKSSKPVMEKRRRARINASLAELKSLLLDAIKMEGTRHSKMEKADILELAVRHLKDVHSHPFSAATTPSPSALSKYAMGFHACAAEVSTYLSNGGYEDFTLKSKLLNHLTDCLSDGDSPVDCSHSQITSSNLSISFPSSSDLHHNNIPSSLSSSSSTSLLSSSSNVAPQSTKTMSRVISPPLAATNNDEEVVDNQTLVSSSTQWSPSKLPKSSSLPSKSPLPSVLSSHLTTLTSLPSLHPTKMLPAMVLGSNVDSISRVNKREMLTLVPRESVIVTSKDDDDNDVLSFSDTDEDDDNVLNGVKHFDKIQNIGVKIQSDNNNNNNNIIINNNNNNNINTAHQNQEISSVTAPQSITIPQANISGLTLASVPHQPQPQLLSYQPLTHNPQHFHQQLIQQEHHQQVHPPPHLQQNVDQIYVTGAMKAFPCMTPSVQFLQAQPNPGEIALVLPANILSANGNIQKLYIPILNPKSLHTPAPTLISPNALQASQLPTIQLETSLPSTPQQIIPQTSLPSTPQQIIPQASLPSTPQQIIPQASLPSMPQQIIPQTSLPSTPQQIIPQTSLPSTPQQIIPQTSLPSTPQQIIPQTSLPSTPQQIIPQISLPSTPQQIIPQTSLPSTPQQIIPHPQQVINSGLQIAFQNNIIQEASSSVSFDINNNSNNNHNNNNHNTINKEHTPSPRTQTTLHNLKVTRKEHDCLQGACVNTSKADDVLPIYTSPNDVTLDLSTPKACQSVPSLPATTVHKDNDIYPTGSTAATSLNVSIVPNNNAILGLPKLHGSRVIDNRVRSPQNQYQPQDFDVESKETQNNKQIELDFDLNPPPPTIPPTTNSIINGSSSTSHSMISHNISTPNINSLFQKPIDIHHSPSIPGVTSSSYSFKNNDNHINTSSMETNSTYDTIPRNDCDSTDIPIVPLSHTEPNILRNDCGTTDIPIVALSHTEPNILRNDCDISDIPIVPLSHTEPNIPRNNCDITNIHIVPLSHTEPNINNKYKRHRSASPPQTQNNKKLLADYTQSIEDSYSVNVLDLSITGTKHENNRVPLGTYNDLVHGSIISVRDTSIISVRDKETVQEPEIDQTDAMTRDNNPYKGSLFRPW